MKVAIIGSGPLAIEMGIRLFLEEASVTIFTKGDLGGSVAGLYPFLGDSLLGEKFSDITSKEGWSLLSKGPSNLKPTLNNYWEEYLKPLGEKVRDLGLVKKGEVLRVKKCFFSPSDEKRLRDLFRIFYSIDPGESILKSIEENPLVFEKLGKEVLGSLKEKMEFFEDFDLVVDARGVLFNPLPMGSSHGEALNEGVISKTTPVFYGLNGFSNLEKIKNDSKTILIVGSGETASFYLHLLSDWFFANLDKKLYLVTRETQVFKESENFKEFQAKAEVEFQKKADIFQEKINAWKELEDYEKAKIQKPEEPARRFEIFSGSTVSSLDRLLDRNNLFVTIDNQNELKTLPVDSILVVNGFQIDTSLFKGLHMDFDYGEKTAKSFLHDEPGIYTLGPTNKKKRYNLKYGLDQIPLILENMLTFFSKRK